MFFILEYSFCVSKRKYTKIMPNQYNDAGNVNKKDYCASIKPPNPRRGTSHKQGYLVEKKHSLVTYLAVSPRWLTSKGECSDSHFFPFSVILPPIAYALRPSSCSFFFRLETLFLPFFAPLYYTINQFFTHPFYTNRPRFV